MAQCRTLNKLRFPVLHNTRIITHFSRYTPFLIVSSNSFATGTVNPNDSDPNKDKEMERDKEIKEYWDDPTGYSMPFHRLSLESMDKTDNGDDLLLRKIAIFTSIAVVIGVLSISKVIGQK